MSRVAESLEASLSVDDVEKGSGTFEFDNVRLMWMKEQQMDCVVLNLNCISTFTTISRRSSLKVKYLTEEDQFVVYNFKFKTKEEVCKVLDFLLDNLNVDRAFDDQLTNLRHTKERVTTVILKTYVTCLKFIGNRLFAGVGDVLHIYTNDGGTWVLLVTKKIFRGQNIYGIEELTENELIVFGGKTVSLLRTLSSASNIKIRVVYCFQCQDWILDVISLQDREIVLLTANNALFLFKLSLLEPEVLSVSHCEIRCILYSGKLLGTRWNNIVVLAGTVFSTIIIWVNDGSCQAKPPVHQLEGHKGVIFSIVFCPKTKRICSTSDDRSVKLWDVVFSDTSDWHHCSITLKYSLFGHSARVWKSIFVNGMIVSVGEDSRVCLWNNDGTLANQWHAHQDGEVWSLDVSNNLIATGGSDGGINFWPISVSSIPKALDFNGASNRKPKCVGFLDSGVPYMMDSAGEMFTFNDGSWKYCFSDLRFSSYCQHTLSPSRTLLALGSIRGNVVIYNFVHASFEKLVDIQVCEGRIFNLIWLTESTLVVSESEGKFSTWELSLDSSILKRDREFILPYSKERWITSCASSDLYLVCGDRLGSLFLYKKSREDQNPVSSAKRIHGHNGVTDVKFLDGKFVSSGRDGKYREFVVENDNLMLLRCCRLKLDWAAAVFDNQIMGRILICFHEVSFIIWSLQHRRTILKIDCGGGHRSWDCMIDQSARCIFVAYIKGKTVHYCHIPFNDILCYPLLPGGHPKAINAAAIVPHENASLKFSHLVLLGGEDTSLRLVSVNVDDVTQLNVLQSHLSSVRTVSCLFSKCHDSLLIASGGGRGQIVVWKVYDAKGSLEVVELASFFVMQPSKDSWIEQAQHSDSAEMRIMDLQIYQTSSRLIYVAAGCSDGVLRICSFCTESHLIVMTQEVAFGHCLLKVIHVNKFTDSFLMSTFTDGTVAFLKMSEDGQVDTTNEPKKYSVSDSGINSCDIIVKNNRLVVSCAGDSAHVNILVLENATFQLLHKWTDKAAHYCQVSGLSISDKFLFTTGLDQLLSIFSWNLISDEVHANLVSQVKLSISDIHGSLIWKHSADEYEIFVYGLGSQLLHFDGQIL